MSRAEDRRRAERAAAMVRSLEGLGVKIVDGPVAGGIVVAVRVEDEPQTIIPSRQFACRGGCGHMVWLSLTLLGEMADPQPLCLQCLTARFERPADD